MSMRELTRPPRLRRGDTVALVAPAGPVPEELLEAGIAQLRAWDLDVRVGKHVLDRHPRLDYLAGTDADRATDLQEAWCDPQVSAVLCVRGGYGSLRMIDHLDFAELAAAGPKLLVGSSDITALHEVFAAELGLVTIFAPMVATKAFVHDEKARDHLRRTLFEPQGVTILTGRSARTMVPGRALGITYGGNLSLLAGSLGAGRAARPPERGIALLEDVTEEPYRLDRFLIQLIRAGFFQRATGIVLGSWTDCGEVDAVYGMLENLLGDLGVPILWDLGFGHCEAQRTIPLGVAAELDADAQRLSVLQPALR